MKIKIDLSLLLTLILSASTSTAHTGNFVGDTCSVMLLEVNISPTPELIKLLENGNSFGGFLYINSGKGISIDHLWWIYQRANPAFKLNLLDYSRGMAISLVADSNKEELINTRAEFSRLESGDSGPNDYASLLHRFLRVGTSIDIQRILGIYPSLNKYAQHLALSVIEEIKAREEKRGVVVDSVWEISPIREEINRIYFEGNHLGDLATHWVKYFRYFTMDDIRFILRKIYTEKPKMVILILEMNIFGEYLAVPNEIIHSSLSWLRKRIKSKVNDLKGNTWSDVGYPNQSEFNFLAKYGDVSDGSDLQTFIDMSLRADIAFLGRQTLLSVMTRPSTVRLPF